MGYFWYSMQNYCNLIKQFFSILQEKQEIPNSAVGTSTKRPTSSPRGRSYDLEQVGTHAGW